MASNAIENIFFFNSLLERVQLQREQGSVHSAAGLSQADAEFCIDQSQGISLLFKRF